MVKESNIYDPDYDNPKICIVDSSLITCTLLYRKLEDIIPNSDIVYYIDPADLLLDKLKSCDLIIIDELLSHHRGTEVIGYLYDFMKNEAEEHNMSEEKFNDKFPRIIFFTYLNKGNIISRLKDEGIYDKLPYYTILEKPLELNGLENVLRELCPSVMAKPWEPQEPTSSLKLALSGFREIF